MLKSQTHRLAEAGRTPWVPRAQPLQSQQGYPEQSAEGHVPPRTISIHLAEAFPVSWRAESIRYLRELSATTAPVDRQDAVWGRLRSALPVRNVVIPSQFDLKAERGGK